MKKLSEILSTHLVFKDLKPAYINFLAENVSEDTFKSNSFIFKTGEPAEEFYLIDTGKVALEVYIPPQGPVNIMTLNCHDILGWSWLFPPYKWHFEARAISDVTLFTFDGIKIRQECRKDHEFGFNFTICFSQILMQRLAATRLQLLDIFGANTEPNETMFQ